MKNLKAKIQEIFTEDYNFNLDTLSPDELKFIDDYLIYMNQLEGVFKISKITNDETKLRIEVKTSTTRFKK